MAPSTAHAIRATPGQHRQRAPLTALGIPRLWGRDPERLWPFMRLWLPTIVNLLAPGAGYGLERVPASGGGVVAINHFTAIDPPLVGSYSPRAIYYLTKSELLGVPLVGEVLRWTGAFAVRRGEADRDALRVARWLVRHGHLVGVFVEGTRQTAARPGRAQPGAAMIALQENVPVIPCGIDTHGWTLRRRRRSAVVWGEPIRLDGLPRSGSGIKEATRIIESEVRRLWRQATDAADRHPNRLPDGTPRHRPPRPRGAHRPVGAPPWPTEPWAAEPLGPLHRDGGTAPGAVRELPRVRPSS